MLSGDAGLCLGSCVGEPWMSGLLFLSLEFATLKKKKKKRKRQKDGLQYFWKGNLMRQRNLAKHLIIKHMPQFPPNFEGYSMV